MFSSEFLGTLLERVAMKLICLSFQCLEDRFRNSLCIPSSVACSKSESGFFDQVFVCVASYEALRMASP